MIFSAFEVAVETKEKSSMILMSFISPAGTPDSFSIKARSERGSYHNALPTAINNLLCPLDDPGPTADISEYAV